MSRIMCAFCAFTEDRIEQLGKERDTATDALKAISEEFKSMEHRNQDATKQQQIKYEALCAERDAAIAEHDSTKDEFARLKAKAIHSISVLKSAVAGLKHKTEKFAGERDAALAEKEAALTNCAAAAGECDAIKVLYVSVSVDLTRVTAEKETASNSNTILSFSLSAARKETEAMQAERDAALAERDSWSQRNGEMMAALRERDADISNLQQALGCERETTAKLRAEHDALQQIIAEHEEDETQNEEKCNEFVRPTLNRTAYMTFVKDVRARTQNENPEMSFIDITMKIAREWEALPARDKQLFEERATVDKARYEREKFALRQISLQKSQLEDQRAEIESYLAERDAALAERDSWSQRNGEMMTVIGERDSEIEKLRREFYAACEIIAAERERAQIDLEREREAALLQRQQLETRCSEIYTYEKKRQEAKEIIRLLGTQLEMLRTELLEYGTLRERHEALQMECEKLRDDFERQNKLRDEQLETISRERDKALVQRNFHAKVWPAVTRRIGEQQEPKETEEPKIIEQAKPANSGGSFGRTLLFAGLAAAGVGLVAGFAMAPKKRNDDESEYDQQEGEYEAEY